MPGFCYLRLTALAALLLAAGPAAQGQTKPATPKLPTGPVDTAKVYTYVEQMPQPAGGMEGLLQYLGKNMHAPHHYPDNTKVYVSFIVRADGRISNVHVQKAMDPDLDAEAVRVIRRMPAWTPGRQNGQLVKVAYLLPSNFELK